MDEQLTMQVTGKTEDGKRALEPRGPRWRWDEMDKEHWVGYPDKKVKVTEMGDEWLQNVLIYLAKWNEKRVADLWWAWWLNSVYMTGPFPRGDMADMAFDAECQRLQYSTTHRQYLEMFIVPCLPALETEARRRGFDVPAIPSYKCPVTRSREERQAADDARKAKKAVLLAEARAETAARRARTATREADKTRSAREKKKHGRAKKRCSLCRSSSHTAPRCPKNPRNKR